MGACPMSHLLPPAATKPILDSSVSLTLALVGAPNCGKTALFNLLTGSKAKVANYSGVTVDKRSANFIDNHAVRILDLPGTYGLATTSPDEEVTRKVLMGEMPNEPIPDGIIVVADATNFTYCVIKDGPRVKKSGTAQ